MAAEPTGTPARSEPDPLSDRRREPDEYVLGHIADALASDPRVGEQGLSVSIHGGRVFIHGAVPTVERQRAVTEVVAALATDLEIRNETTVAHYDESDVPEQLQSEDLA